MQIKTIIFHISKRNGITLWDHQTKKPRYPLQVHFCLASFPDPTQILPYTELIIQVINKLIEFSKNAKLAKCIQEVIVDFHGGRDLWGTYFNEVIPDLCVMIQDICNISSVTKLTLELPELLVQSAKLREWAALIKWGNVRSVKTSSFWYNDYDYWYLIPKDVLPRTSICKLVIGDCEMLDAYGVYERCRKRQNFSSFEYIKFSGLHLLRFNQAKLDMLTRVRLYLLWLVKKRVSVFHFINKDIARKICFYLHMHDYADVVSHQQTSRKADQFCEDFERFTTYRVMKKADPEKFCHDKILSETAKKLGEYFQQERKRKRKRIKLS